MKNAELIKTLNLDWTVSKQPIQTITGTAIKNKYAIVRDDSNEVLGVVGKAYAPIQNSQLVDLVAAGAEKVGVELVRSREFDGGAKIAVQIKSENLIIGNDLVEGFITGINSHDGSTSLRFGNSNNTVSCKNQFNYLFKNHLKTAFRHTMSGSSAVDAMARDLEVQLEMERVMFEDILRLTQVPVKDFGAKVTDIILKELTGLESKDISEKLSTKKQNILDDIKDSIKSEMDSKGKTLWGAFSGVTHYSTHKISHRASYDAQKMYGHVAKKDATIFDQFVALTK